MKLANQFRRMLAIGLVLLMAAPPVAFAQQIQPAPTFRQEELEQLLAPIALYPDSLLSQVLMASTYPLEVVQADRWARQNKDLKGDALTSALENQNWDPSVKSLVNFPDVLAMMSEKLDWTEKLGNAFLARQNDVMDTIQKLRWKADKAGNLKTTSEQKVIVEKETIVIQPADPQVVYVPAYNPTVVYGTWAYPAYPPYPVYPPGYVVGAAAFSFAAGVAIGAAWGYAWGGCNWQGGNVDVNINRNTNINANINRERYRSELYGKGQVNRSGTGAWQHNPNHRNGVPYRDPATARQYNRGATAEAARSREAYRGRAEAGRQELARGGAQQFKGQQDMRQRGGQAAGTRPGARETARQLQPAGGTGMRETAGRANAFEGMGRGSSTREFSNRGRSSRESMPGSGGLSRGGGGKGGGGLPRGGGGGGRRR